MGVPATATAATPAATPATAAAPSTAATPTTAATASTATAAAASSSDRQSSRPARPSLLCSIHPILLRHMPIIQRIAVVANPDPPPIGCIRLSGEVVNLVDGIKLREVAVWRGCVQRDS